MSPATFTLELRWKGVKETSEMLKALQRKVSGQVHVELGKGAEKIVAVAKTIVPVRTGRLQRSIMYGVAGLMKFEVGSPVYYAAYVEYGTTKMRAQPYLRPAINQVLPETIQNICRSILAWSAGRMRGMR